MCHSITVNAWLLRSVLNLCLLHILFASDVLLVQEPAHSHIDQWDLFKVQHRKTYTTSDEEHVRKKIFLENLKFIQDHNLKFRNGSTTYTLGVNQFADLTNEEFSSIARGLIISNQTNETEKLFDFEFFKTLPRRKDWRKKGAVTSVKDQGPCNAGWAFSAVGSLEGQLFLKARKLYTLSAQNIIDCSKNDGDHGCRCGMITGAFEYVRLNKGIDTEESYPYFGKDGVCQYKAKNRATTISGFVRITSGNERALVTAIAKAGPVSVAIDSTTGGFQFYRDGVFSDSVCSTTEVNSAMLAVGYGYKRTLGKFYWLKSSWSRLWGMDGYMALARDMGNMCGVATLASYPIV